MFSFTKLNNHFETGNLKNHLKAKNYYFCPLLNTGIYKVGYKTDSNVSPTDTYRLCGYGLCMVPEVTSDFDDCVDAYCNKNQTEVKANSIQRVF